MIVSFEEIQDLSSQLVRFYSVRFGPDPLLEFEKFDSKEFSDQNHIEERDVIFKTINQIGKRGAKPYFFRPEGPAVALPGYIRELIEKDSSDFGVRLYGVLIDIENVILLNGDVKTKKDPKECQNVCIHFKRAVKIADKLQKAISDGYIQFGPNGIEKDENYILDI